jgi:hypothetical protein
MIVLIGATIIALVILFAIIPLALAILATALTRYICGRD